MVTNAAISLLGLLLTVVRQRRMVPPGAAGRASRISRSAASACACQSARALPSRGCPSARCIGRCCLWRRTRSPPGSKVVSQAASPCRFRRCFTDGSNITASGTRSTFSPPVALSVGQVKAMRSWRSFICADFWQRSRFTAPSRYWSDCSMARCSRCFPNGRFLLAALLRLFCGRDWSTASLGIVSPILDQRIDWLWFTISQCAFGLVAGFVVNLDVKVRTPQFQALPFAVRAGLHTDLGESAPRRKTIPNERGLQSAAWACSHSLSGMYRL